MASKNILFLNEYVYEIRKSTLKYNKDTLKCFQGIPY